MSSYGAVYEKQFVRNLKRYSSLKERIRKKAERIADDPYRNTESLVDAAGLRAAGAIFLADTGAEG